MGINQCRAHPNAPENFFISTQAPAAAAAFVNRATTPPATTTKKLWLAVGLPTVPRLNDEDYLGTTLNAFARELFPAESMLAGAVGVFVVNVHGPGHKRFDEAQARFSSNTAFRFSEKAEDPALTANRVDPPHVAGNANRPGWRVRKQTRDIVSVLRAAEGAAAYFLFAEDDMKLCGHGLFAAAYVVRRAERAYPNFMAVRASFGMNGIFIHDSDIAHFSAYMLAHQARRPPDHLVVEWFAGETEESRTYRGDRQHLGFRWNFFDHIGARSTLRAQTSGKMPACYEELLAPVVFPVEAYHPKRCPNHDFTPCGNLRTPALDLGAMRRFRAR